MAGAVAADPPVGGMWLSLDVAVDGDRSVLFVRGEIDMATLTLLDTVVAGVIDDGCAHLVIDASGVDFMDCFGLRLVVTAADRLGRGGGGVVIRSPSARVDRLLEITGVAAVVPIERQAPSAPARPNGSGLAGALTRIAAIPASTDMTDAALSAVVVLAAATIGVADGVSVTLRRHGRLVTAAASGDVIVDLDQHQYDTREGPCVDASTEGQRFHLESVDEEPRWPAFTARLLEKGFRSILSTPVVTSTGPVGALNLYARSSRAFDVGEQERASVFASQASAVVSHAAVEVSVEQVANRLHAALEVRGVIAQAQGVLMAQTGASAQEAHAALRERSQMSGSPLIDQARSVIAATQRS